MDIIDYVSKTLDLSREEAIKNSKVIEDGLTYYWNPERGGGSIIVNEKGDYLAAVSGVNFNQHLEDYKKGERVKNFFSQE